jgi:acyl-CoA synthetase (AMP-forming)/AMP-acid ligase II/acyl carrier protein
LTTIATLLEQLAATAPDGIALEAPDRAPLDHAGLVAQVRVIGAGLAGAGVRPGDRVALLLPDGPELITAFLGVASHVASAPLNPAYRRPELEFYLGDLEPSAVIVLEGSDSPVVALARERGIPVLEVRAGPDDPAGRFALVGASTSGGESLPFATEEDVALVLHTSGTTSRPKQVPLTHGNVLASARHIGETLALSPDDRCLNVMPLFHIHGLIAAVLSSIDAGASVVATPGFDPTRFFGWLDAHEPTWTTAVPTMWQSLLGRAARHRDVIERRPLRFLRSSSASMPPTVMAELEEVFGAPLVEAYGMTEAAHQMACNPLPPRARKPGSVGPAAGPEVAVADEETGAILERGERGEVVIRGPNVTKGYTGNRQATAEAFREGWFRTGDQGYLDEDGYLFLTGRLKEMINRAGENISPREIDEVLLEHPDVAQALCFAMPDRLVGEEVAAAIVAREGSDLDDRALWDHCAGELADFKVPRRFVFLDAIPKGPTGKLQRIGLAEKLGLTGEAAVAATSREAETETEKALVAHAAELLEVDAVGPDDDLLALGADSIVATRLVLRAGEILGRTLPPHALFASPTIAGLIAFANRLEASEDLPPSPVGPGEPGPTLPLQDMLWMAERLLPDTGVNHRPGVIALEGPLDAIRLREALDALARRHGALRARLPTVERRPVLVVEGPGALGPSFEETDDERAFFRRPFDLERGPLARFALVRCGPESHRLLVDVHHAVFDAWSMEILFRDLVSLLAGETPAPVPLNLADVAAWRRTQDRAGAFAEGLGWWRDRLADFTALPLPRKPDADPEGIDPAGDETFLEVSPEIARAAAERGRSLGLTPFAVDLAAFSSALARWCGREEISLGIPVSGREVPGSEAAVGLFLNYVVFRLDLSGCSTTEELLDRTGTALRETLAHQDVPYPFLVRELRPPVHPGRNPLFEVLFQHKPFGRAEAAVGPLTLRLEEAWAGDARFDLYVEVVREDGLSGRVEFRRAALDEERVRELIDLWTEALATIARGE